MCSNNSCTIMYVYKYLYCLTCYTRCTPMKYGTIPPMRVAHRPSVRPGILSLGSHPCFFFLLFYFLLACSIIFLLNTAAFPSFLFFILYLCFLHSFTLLSSLQPSHLSLLSSICSSMSQPNPNERIQVDVRYALFFIFINSPVMQCQLRIKKAHPSNQKILITMINDLFFLCYLAAGAETRKW